MARKVRWGHVSEIKRQHAVGSTAWFQAHPPRLQKLSAWRFLHVKGAHTSVRRQARKRGVKPSSNMSVAQMLSSAQAMRGKRA